MNVRTRMHDLERRVAAAEAAPKVLTLGRAPD